jgi:hypothetical protein
MARRARSSESAFTLVELVLTLALTSLIVTATVGLLRISLRAETAYDEENALQQEGLLAMEKMSAGVKKSVFLLIPNSARPTRGVLAYSDLTNADNDFYFDDSAFPRIAEDAPGDITADGFAGIKGFDYDGDGTLNEGNADNDDEGAIKDDDPLDGADNSPDGDIDEDPPGDANNDGASGLIGFDDNGDNFTDNGDPQDDDEDGRSDCDPVVPVVFVYNSARKTIEQRASNNVLIGDLCTHVTGFTAVYQWDATWASSPGVLLTLTLTGDDGKTYTFTEYSYPRNLMQRCGKRCR